MNDSIKIKCIRKNIVCGMIFNNQFSINNFLFLLLIFILFSTSVLLSQQKPYWNKTEGLYGGNITCITGNDSHTFIGTLGAGVYKCSYWQESWEPINNGLGDLDIRAIILTDKNTLLAGTYRFGIYRSTDFGQVWTSTNIGIDSDNFLCFAQDSDGTIWAGSYYGGIYQSNNEGETWYESGLKEYDIWSIAAKKNGNIFAGTKSGILCTTNKGVNWFNTDSGLPTYDVRTIVIISDTIYAGTAKGVFQSSDNGATWKDLNDSLSNLDVWTLLPDIDGELYTGTRGDGIYIWSSLFGRYCWRKEPFLQDDIWIRCIKFCYGGIIYAGSGEDGVFRGGKNGQNWNSMNGGINNLDVSSIAITKNSSLYAGTATAGIYKLDSNFNNWVSMRNKLKNEYIISIVVDTNDNIYVGTYGNGVYYSENNGDSFIQLVNGLIDRNIYSLTIDKNNRAIAGTGGSGIYRYEPDSLKWIQINNGLTHPVVYTLVKAPNGFLYAGTPGAGIFKSENNGDNWTQSNNGLNRLYVKTITVSTNGDVIAGTDARGAFISKNNGDNWSYIGLSGTDIRSIVFGKDGYIYVATRDDGIYRSKLETNLWELVNDGLIDNSIQALITDNNGRLFAAVHRNGIYMYDPASGVDEYNNNYDFRFYPNPVQDEINILINLDKNERTGQIRIFNMLGLQVKQLNTEPGVYKYILSIIDIPNGFYFINYNSQSKPIIICK